MSFLLLRCERTLSMGACVSEHSSPISTYPTNTHQCNRLLHRLHPLPMDANGLESLQTAQLGRLHRLRLGRDQHLPSSLHVLARSDDLPRRPGHSRSDVRARRPAVPIVLLPPRETRSPHRHLHLRLRARERIRWSIGVWNRAGERVHWAVADSLHCGRIADVCGGGGVLVPYPGFAIVGVLPEREGQGSGGCFIPSPAG